MFVCRYRSYQWSFVVYWCLEDLNADEDVEVWRQTNYVFSSYTLRRIWNPHQKACKCSQAPGMVWNIMPLPQPIRVISTKPLWSMANVLMTSTCSGRGWKPWIQTSLWRNFSIDGDFVGIINRSLCFFAIEVAINEVSGSADVWWKSNAGFCGENHVVSRWNWDPN
jgi:hypothetical protein